MRQDGSLRSLFRKRLRVGFHWQSIETGGTGLGVPDSNYCCDGVEGWVEFKQTTGWAVSLRPEQVGWLVARSRAGGRVFVAVRRLDRGGPRKGGASDELWLLKGESARELKHDGLRCDVAVLGAWGGGPSAWDWNEVRSLLVGSSLGAPNGAGG